MSKKLFYSITLVVVTFTLSSCVKAVADAIEESVDAIECANRLTTINNDENSTCDEIRADIDAILSSCREFLSQEEIDDLNFARENCSDN